MDPNANILEQLKLIERLANMPDIAVITATDLDDKNRNSCDVACEAMAIMNDAQRLAELASSLHTWIGKGGFLPKYYSRTVKRS